MQNLIKLRCKECDGYMTVDANRGILNCPYCGSKEFIDVSDEVKIARDKNRTKRKIELEKMRLEAEEKKRNDKVLIFLFAVMFCIWLIIYLTNM